MFYGSSNRPLIWFWFDQHLAEPLVKDNKIKNGEEITLQKTG